MANMYPKSIAEYMPTDSERIVYQELKNQLPDTYDVFYSVKWTSQEDGVLVKSEADFIVASQEFGFLCLEVKGGAGIKVKDNVWYVSDRIHGERRLNCSPYDQAEKSMYFFLNTFSRRYNTKYQGIFGAGAVFPFYAIDDNVSLDNRNRACTIDCNDLNNIYVKIKKMFRFWGGESFGRRFYSKDQHEAFLQLVRERIAVSAAAGALVKYKEQQLNVINRVQDNYIYFLENIRQFYVKGGAGTGKTWIAMKMAMKEVLAGKSALFVCESETLAAAVGEHIGSVVDVMNLKSLLAQITRDSIIGECRKYDAIFVDEAQDFTEKWAQSIRLLLKDPANSRLGIFYDDVQILREDSFSNGFGIGTPPFLLRENIRNTANIYKWTAEKTHLGQDVIANPVEGPSPQTEIISEKGQLTLRLESLLKLYLVDEHLHSSSIVILTDDVDYLLETYPSGIAKWGFVQRKSCDENEIRLASVEDFKGLESDMVIYIHSPQASENMNYIAYTRAKYYLIEFVREY